jgi:cytochrome c oxidase subunit 3
MASMVMLFAGFTSAYLVKRGDTQVWQSIELPSMFWISTTLILISSLTVALAVRGFKKNKLTQYRSMTVLTTILGAGFLLTQILAWKELGLRISESIAADYVYVISGAHFAHVGGGVLALLVSCLLAFFKFKSAEDTLIQNINPDKVPAIELVATYWHFVDVLWIYLFVFLITNS